MDLSLRQSTNFEKVFYIDGQNLTPNILESILEDKCKIDLTPKAWEDV